MKKLYTALGLMSGTSGDGIDASIINSDGETSYEVIFDKYYEYNENIYNKIHSLKDRINSSKDLSLLKNDLNNLEKDITLFHAKVIKEILKNLNFDLIGFHGQTVYHNSKEKISKQLGDANLLFQLINKKIVYDFRKQDLENGGEGAPLTPIFHNLILKNNLVKTPSCILNIGGISNITLVEDYDSFSFTSRDIGPGNCLIDKWVRGNSKNKFDKDGMLANRGTINEIILEQIQELYENNSKNISLDVNDFDVSFARGLSLEDGAATLTEFTSAILASAISLQKKKFNKDELTILLAGGGRKNKTLIRNLKKKLSSKIKLQLIDDYEIDGDFVESQAFAFLSIRSLLRLPISFPNTTGCNKPSLGGKLISN
tara:strand:- start:7134 stop:8246 length:1113 start_codon:yes stop_codon:yes gene_type:complete